MPISVTQTFSEEHWADVLKLLHRGITAAGFVPKNVWDSATTDRISERIIGNIFSTPLMVVDISDQNPNVMFELGLRLASKRPTVVIANKGGNIPFDIRDFQALFYPPDMNMLGMEEFLTKLGKALKERHSAYLSENYTPFLGRVIVDVASPETREVGANDIIMSRLIEISERIARIESNSSDERSGSRAGSRNRIRANGEFDFIIPAVNYDHFADEIDNWYEVDRVVQMAVGEDSIRGRVYYSEAPSSAALYDRLQDLIKTLAGDMEVPF